MSIEDKPVFRDLSAEDPDQEVTEVESMCMNCHKNVSMFKLFYNYIVVSN